MNATLWTVIESRGDASDEAGVRQSGEFPSRIMEGDVSLALSLAGVDNSGLLRGHSDPCSSWSGQVPEYRILWRIVTRPIDVGSFGAPVGAMMGGSTTVPAERQSVTVPIGRRLSLSYAHGGSRFFSLSLGGVDVVLTYDVATRTLATSWFTPSFSASWTLGLPKRLLTSIVSRLWSGDSLAEPQERTDVPSAIEMTK